MYFPPRCRRDALTIGSELRDRVADDSAHDQISAGNHLRQRDSRAVRNDEQFNTSIDLLHALSNGKLLIGN
jgi:hypothetical protein